jgi:predicted transcriptional regulator
MSDRKYALRNAAGEGSSHVLRCDACGDVVLSMEATTPKVCCGEEMQSVSEPPTGRSQVESNDPKRVLESVFGIGKTAVEICFRVLHDNEATAGEIAEATGLDQSGVSRHLNHLHELGLVDKSVKNLSDGGSVNVYTAPSSERVQQQPQLLLFYWAADALGILQALNREKLDLLDHRTPPSEAVYWESEPSDVGP